MPDLSWLSGLFNSPLSIGVVIGIVALLFLGKDAPAAELLKLVPKIGLPSKSPASPEHDCHAALMCLANHADKAGKVELRDTVVALMPEFMKLHFPPNVGE